MAGRKCGIIPTPTCTLEILASLIRKNNRQTTSFSFTTQSAVKLWIHTNISEIILFSFMRDKSPSHCYVLHLISYRDHSFLHRNHKQTCIYTLYLYIIFIWDYDFCIICTMYFICSTLCILPYVNQSASFVAMLFITAGLYARKGLSNQSSVCMDCM